MSNSQKISQFQNQGVIDDADQFTLVRQKTNYNVTFSNFKLSLGVTGTLTSIGDPLGAPILSVPSPNDYQIRSIDQGAGTLPSLSASDGVKIDVNFTQGVTGSQVIKDVTAEQTFFRSLVAGTGVNIASTDDSIQISSSLTPESTKTVIVNEESDFPAPSGGVITLESDTDYLIVQDISTANRFVVSAPNTIRAASSQMVELEYTGAGDMFTGVNPNFKIFNITVSAPNGNIFSTTAPSGFGIVQMVESNIDSCQNIGTIDGNFITRFTNVAFENIAAGGVTFSGANNILVVDVGVAFLGGGALIDLGTSTFNTVSISGGNIASSAPGTFFLSGAAASANINPGGLGSVINNNGFGSGTALNGISTDDARWNFLANNNIPDTRPDGLLTFDTPTTTVLSAATPALITGAWTSERVSQMEGTAAGRLTYKGEKNSTLPVTATLSLEPASGTNKDVNVYLAKNGVVITNSKVITTVSSGSPKNQSVVWQDSWAENDYYEVWIESVDGTNVQVNSAKLRVN